MKQRKKAWLTFFGIFLLCQPKKLGATTTDFANCMANTGYVCGGFATIGK